MPSTPYVVGKEGQASSTALVADTKRGYPPCLVVALEVMYERISTLSTPKLYKRKGDQSQRIAGIP